MLIGFAGLFVGLQGSLPIGMLGGMISFVGVLLFTPVLVPAAFRAVGPLARLGGVPGRLAFSNSMRNSRRTAATSTALLIGVTLITSVVVGTASISHKVNTSLDANHRLDLVVNTPSGSLPDGIDKRLADVRGVAQSIAVPGVTARLDKDEVTVLGVDETALGVVRSPDPLERCFRVHAQPDGPVGSIGLIFLVATVAGLTACVIPARQAARIAPAAGLVAD